MAVFNFDSTRALGSPAFGPESVPSLDVTSVTRRRPRALRVIAYDQHAAIGLAGLVGAGSIDIDCIGKFNPRGHNSSRHFYFGPHIRVSRDGRARWARRPRDGHLLRAGAPRWRFRCLVGSAIGARRSP